MYVMSNITLFSMSRFSSQSAAQKSGCGFAQSACLSCEQTFIRGFLAWSWSW
jgi:hypothetical protein